MTLADRIPALDDKELANLHANALRLRAGEGKRGAEAGELLPLIETEMAERNARKPQKAPAKAGKARPAATAAAE